MYRDTVELEPEDVPECNCKRKGKNCDSGTCSNRAALTECFSERCSESYERSPLPPPSFSLSHQPSQGVKISDFRSRIGSISRS